MSSSSATTSKATTSSGSSAAPTGTAKVPVEVVKGINGLDKVILRQKRRSSAEVYLYGAHVTSWKNERGEEMLYLSSKAIFQPRQPIRGGIPIFFPHFPRNGQPHGFARNRFWSIEKDPPPMPVYSNSSYVDLLLKPSELDKRIWPHNFEFRLRVSLSPDGELLLTSRIRNLNPEGKPFSFTFAYYNHFRVSDIREIRVEGLETLHYLDKTKALERFTDQGHAITFESEVDNIYLKAPTQISILDHERRRTYVIRKEGFLDAVVWNPWDKKSKEIADIGNDDYKQMLCVGAAAVENPITLKPGQEWKGRQELSVVSSSYFSGELDPQKVVKGG